MSRFWLFCQFVTTKQKNFLHKFGCKLFCLCQEFIVLDEAASALDTNTENSVQEALDRLEKDRTVLVIAYKIGTVRNDDNDGEVLEWGKYYKVMEFNGEYWELWNIQLDSTGSSHGNLTQIRKLEYNKCIMHSIFYSLIIWLLNFIVKLSTIIKFVIASTQ